MPFKKLFRKYRNLLTPALRDDHFYHSCCARVGSPRFQKQLCVFYVRVVFAAQRRQSSTTMVARTTRTRFAKRLK